MCTYEGCVSTIMTADITSRTWDIELRLRSSASFSHAKTSLRPMVLRWMGLSRRLAPQEYALCPDAVLPTDFAQRPPSCLNDRQSQAEHSQPMMGHTVHVHGDTAEAEASRTDDGRAQHTF